MSDVIENGEKVSTTVLDDPNLSETGTTGDGSSDKKGQPVANTPLTPEEDDALYQESLKEYEKNNAGEDFSGDSFSDSEDELPPKEEPKVDTKPEPEPAPAQADLDKEEETQPPKPEETIEFWRNKSEQAEKIAKDNQAAFTKVSQKVKDLEERVTNPPKTDEQLAQESEAQKERNERIKTLTDEDPVYGELVEQKANEILDKKLAAIDAKSKADQKELDESNSEKIESEKAEAEKADAEVSEEQASLNKQREELKAEADRIFWSGVETAVPGAENLLGTQEFNEWLGKPGIETWAKAQEKEAGMKPEGVIKVVKRYHAEKEAKKKIGAALSYNPDGGETGSGGPMTDDEMHLEACNEWEEKQKASGDNTY